MDTTSKKIFDFYNSKGFLERYGVDLFITAIILLIVFIMASYYSVMNQLEPIRTDWANKRCNPSVMPFAGIINAPEGESKFKYAAENFTGCVNNILKSMSEQSFSPLYYLMNVINTSLNGLKDSVNSMRSMFNNIRTETNDVTNEIYGRLLNVTLPIMSLFINVKDMIGKAHGIITSTLYTLIGSYMGLKALIGSIYQFVVMILVGMGILIAIFWATFNFGTAAATTVLFIAIAIPLGIIGTAMKNVFHMSGHRKMPKIPRCFDEDTELTLSNGKVVKIKDIQVNDTLIDGERVTATMKSTTEDHSFFDLNGIIVTGTHMVFHDVMGWVQVQNHPESIYISDYFKPYMYCIGTNTKIFRINELIFADWDELTDNDIDEIRQNACHILPDIFSKNDIHEYLDGGFTHDTKISLYNGDTKHISKLQVGDMLLYGVKVQSIVKLDACKLRGVYKYNIEGKIIKGGPNLQIHSNNLGIIDTTLVRGEKLKNVDFIYHLVTDRRFFYVNDLRVCDYNAGIDKFVNDKREFILLSSLIQK
jgi:hypothetical protein